MTAPEIPDRCEAVIVGAGLAGLACARTLRAAGREVIVIEASDAVGGRVRTDVVEGFQLDRGFQVVLTAYPELERQLDVSALRLQHFEPGALVWRGGRGTVVADPFRSPRHAVSTALAPIGSPWDKVRIARLRRRVQHTPVPTLLRGDDVTTLAGLHAEGFSAKAIDRFFRPLFGGIQLDPELKTSNRMFTTIFRMLADGSAAVPALGMGAIPSQLAAGLERSRIVTGTRVEHVEPGRVTLAGDRTIAAGAVVVATDGPTASTLVGLPSVGSKSVTGLWFAAPKPPVPHRLVVLDGDGTGPAMNVAVLSNVAPTYAPEG
ncbi:MAG TPA: NAD(P)/FAD-dependent oxidoreductase, partial [Acidimicrobiales bacterium]